MLVSWFKGFFSRNELPISEQIVDTVLNRILTKGCPIIRQNTASIQNRPARIKSGIVFFMMIDSYGIKYNSIPNELKSTLCFKVNEDM